MEAPGVAQLIDHEVDLGRRPGDGHNDFAPVALQLLAGLRFEVNRRSAQPQGPLWSDVLPQDCLSPTVTFDLYLAQNHNGIPDTLGQQPVDSGLEGR